MNAKLVIIPLVAIVLVACGGTVTISSSPNPQTSTQASSASESSELPDPKAEAEATVDRMWASQPASDRVWMCKMYHSDKASMEKLIRMNIKYSARSAEEMQLWVDANFARLDKEC